MEWSNNAAPQQPAWASQQPPWEQQAPPQNPPANQQAPAPAPWDGQQNANSYPPTAASAQAQSGFAPPPAFGSQTSSNFLPNNFFSSPTQVRFPSWRALFGDFGVSLRAQQMAAQVGLDYATSTMSASRDRVASWVSPAAVRPYFAVSTSFVVRKLALVLFPFRNKSWARKLDSQTGKPLEPRNDINAPDLCVSPSRWCVVRRSSLTLAPLDAWELCATPRPVSGAIVPCLVLDPANSP